MSSTEPTRPADLERVVGDEPADELVDIDERSIEEADRRNGEPGATTSSAATPRTPTPGTDTPTGTDPGATYDQPGYEDKSLGQAVEQDRALVDELLEATDGDEAEAEARFERESAGRTTLHRQHAAGSDGPGTSS